MVPKPDGSQNPYAPHFDPEDPTGRALIIPVFFLYPQYATSDVVPEFVEDTPFAEHLKAMFPPQTGPPEWDTKGEYVDGQIVIYAMTRREAVTQSWEKDDVERCLHGCKGEGRRADGRARAEGWMFDIRFTTEG